MPKKRKGVNKDDVELDENLLDEDDSNADDNESGTEEFTDAQKWGKRLTHHVIIICLIACFNLVSLLICDPCVVPLDWGIAL